MGLPIAFLLTVIAIFNVSSRDTYIAPQKPTVIQAEVTAYTASTDETDETPEVGASGKRMELGMAACPARIPFGTKIEVAGQVFTCEDRMHRRYRDGNFFDLLVGSKIEAKQWGRQVLAVSIY